MIHQHNLIARTVTALLCAVILVGGGALDALAGPSARLLPDELAAARARWSSVAPARYRLRVEEVNVGIRCAQDVVIQGERIVTTAHNSCDHTPWTIGDLFIRAERDAAVSRRPLGACVVYGCACTRTPTLQTTYDPLLGYPQERRARVEITANWLSYDFWMATLQQHRLLDCATVVDRAVLIASVERLPLDARGSH